MKRSLWLLFLLGCDEVITVRNGPPTVTVTAFCTDADGRAFFGVEVLDREEDPVDIDLVAEVDGQRAVLASGSAGDGTQGLSSGEVAVTHWIQWADTCSGEGCVDPCSGRPVGPSRVTACALAPAAVPEALAVTVFATDGGGRFEERFELVRGTCP